MANLTLTGRRDLKSDGRPLTNPVQPIQLSDYFQNKNYRALVVSLAATWCVPCINEQPTLNEWYLSYRSAGGRVGILEGVLQDQSGSPATEEVVDAWARSYQTPFDVAYDPMGSLTPYYDPRVFPTKMVVATSTMTMIYFNVGGGDEEQLKAAIGQALAN
jgi:hypothetical protein